MTLTHEENELLTRIGPGTPAGEVLRRYWHPIAVAQELTDENPTKFVRVLGEDLVLFKDRSGNVGVIADHCMLPLTSIASTRSSGVSSLTRLSIRCGAPSSRTVKSAAFNPRTNFPPCMGPHGPEEGQF